ncbi:MAG: hypothetical protein NZ879_08300 [Archaeoglobaceae archaeon]|nr:hypothetical protein [Archaeoglobaceae archaeon]MDW8118966.1 hypothetical protein [Archaeoglobaceae archaeon]
MEEASQKLFEIKKEDLESVLNKLKSMVPTGCFVLVYDKELNVVAEYDPEEEKKKVKKSKRRKK